MPNHSMGPLRLGSLTLAIILVGCMLPMVHGGSLDDSCETVVYFNGTGGINITTSSVAPNSTYLKQEQNIQDQCSLHFSRCGFCVQQPPCQYCESTTFFASEGSGCLNPAYIDSLEALLPYKIQQLAEYLTQQGFERFWSLPDLIDLEAETVTASKEAYNTAYMENMDTDFTIGGDIFPNYLCADCLNPDPADTISPLLYQFDNEGNIVYEDCECTLEEKLGYMCRLELRPDGLEIPEECATLAYNPIEDRDTCEQFENLGAPLCGKEWQRGLEEEAPDCTTAYAKGCGCDRGYYNIPAEVFERNGFYDEELANFNLELAGSNFSTANVENSLEVRDFIVTQTRMCSVEDRVDGVSSVCKIYRDNDDNMMRIEAEHYQTCYDYLTNSLEDGIEVTDVQTDDAEWELEPIPYDMTQVPCCTMCCCQSRRWNEQVYLNKSLDGSFAYETEMELIDQYPVIACSPSVPDEGFLESDKVNGDICQLEIIQDHDTDLSLSGVSLTMTAYGTFRPAEHSYFLNPTDPEDTPVTPDNWELAYTEAILNRYNWNLYAGQYGGNRKTEFPVTNGTLNATDAEAFYIDFEVDVTDLNLLYDYWIIIPCERWHGCTYNMEKEYWTYVRMKNVYTRDMVAIYPRNMETYYFENNTLQLDNETGTYYNLTNIITYEYYEDGLGIEHRFDLDEGFMDGAAYRSDKFGFAQGNAALCPDVGCDGVYCSEDYECPYIKCRYESLSCPNFDSCSSGENELGGGLNDRTPLTFLSNIRGNPESGIVEYETVTRVPMRTCAFNNEGDVNASTAQADCQSLDFYNNTLGMSLPELWNAGVYWDDKFVNVLSFDAALDIVPVTKKKSAEIGEDLWHYTDDDDVVGSSDLSTNAELVASSADSSSGEGSAPYDDYLSKLLSDDTDDSGDDGKQHAGGGGGDGSPKTKKRKRRKKNKSFAKQDSTSTTTSTTTDYSTAGTTLYDCGMDHQVCEHRPYSYCHYTDSLSTDPECRCLDGFGDYADGCDSYTTHEFCGEDANPETCALVLWLLDRPGCVIEEEDDIDYDCAAAGYTVKECFESGLPLRYRDFAQFVPPSSQLNPSTWQYVRSLGFTDATRGWVMTFFNAGIVASDELKCRCEDQGMRCRCAAELQNFTYQEAFVNGTVEVVDDTFRTYTTGMSNGIEDNLEGATPARGYDVSQRGWTEVVTMSCTKCLSQIDGVDVPEIPSKVCSESFLRTCQSLEGQLGWPVCSYCMVDNQGSNLNTTNIDPEVTRYDEIRVSGRYDIYPIDEWLYPGQPPSTEMQFTMDYKQQKMQWRDQQVLDMRDAVLQTHVEIMTYAAELASKQNRWAGYNYTRGGYNDRVVYGQFAQGFEDIDLISVAKSFCDMIFKRYWEWHSPDEARGGAEHQTHFEQTGCSFCDMAYVDEEGVWDNKTRWVCDFCIDNRIIDDETYNRQDRCLDYDVKLTRTAYRELEVKLGFIDSELSPPFTDQFPEFNADNRLLRLESDIIGFWRWCESDDHLLFIYQKNLNGELPLTDQTPWEFSTADACEQARFTYNPIPSWNTDNGYFEAAPAVPVLYKKWWGTESEDVDDRLNDVPEYWWYGWRRDMVAGKIRPNDGQTLDRALLDYNSIFWGIPQGLDPTEAQAMSREEFMTEDTLMDIDLMWYGFPHNPWRCFEYEDMAEATVEEFQRNKEWESNFIQSPSTYAGLYIYWCGVCDAEIYCDEKDSTCPCFGGVDSETGVPYGFESYCNPYVKYQAKKHAQDIFPTFPTDFDWDRWDRGYTQYTVQGLASLDAAGYLAPAVVHDNEYREPMILYYEEAREEVQTVDDEEITIVFPPIYPNIRYEVGFLEASPSQWTNNQSAQSLVNNYNRSLCPHTTPLALAPRIDNGFNLLNTDCAGEPKSIQMFYEESYAPERDERRLHCCWDAKHKDDYDTDRPQGCPVAIR